jgi:hypothetical protein
LQGSFPIFIKIEYGTGSVATIPGLWITVGTATNGSGTLSGTTSTRVTANTNVTLASTVTSYPTYACVKNGFLGVMFKAGAQTAAPNGHAFFAVARTVDDAGAETGDGFTLFRRQSAGNTGGAIIAQSVSVSNATTFTASLSYSLVHMDVTSSAVGADKQVYKNYTIQPRVRPVLQMCTVIATEYSAATTFTATLVGTTPRTYLSGGTNTAFAGANASSAYCNAMLYE